MAALVALLLAPAAPAQDALPGGRALVVRTSVTPDTHFFADSIAARVDVVVDPREFDPHRLRVGAGFAPYDRVGPIQRTQRTVGSLVHIRYSATLRCLDLDCLAARRGSILGEQESGRAERASFQFQPAEVRYVGRRGRGGEVLLTRRFPTVEMVSRVNTAQLTEAAQDFDFAALNTYKASNVPPPPTYRASPALLAAVAFAAAFALFLFPATLLGRFAYARWRERRRPRPLTRLERALALIEWTAQRDDGDEDRRKALEVLAAVLEERGARPLAETARASAWAERSPERDQALELAGEARRTLGGGGNGRVS